MPMTPDAKSALSTTIRNLRTELLADLHSATESAYLLSLPAEKAKLSEAQRNRRSRLEGWIEEEASALPKKERDDARNRLRREVETDAAAALLQRLVYLRLLEEHELRAPKVVTEGWESQGYKAFRELAPELCFGDETEGYGQLLQLVFDDLATELPGLYGDVRLTSLVPIPAKTLRTVVEALDQPELSSCWTDDMTLGWIYQYWNDPAREHLDKKLNSKTKWGSGKIEPHEIASKTQMFTERYMVDWLLQNSLGPMWLAMCQKHGWTPEVEADGTLASLEERRVAWRAQREAGDVELTELMPLENDAERRWAYYVPQPIPEDAVAQANDSVRDLKILDPAVGSGHFLVVAFDLLHALYREEARHRGEEQEAQWSERVIVENILENNLHGIDLDPKVVQIAAAALMLKAKLTCPDARPEQLGLVASDLRLSSLPADDASVVAFRDELEKETGIPSGVTQALLEALSGADHLGSLLKVDSAIDAALKDAEQHLGTSVHTQGTLFSGDGEAKPDHSEQRRDVSVEEAKKTLLGRLDKFLHAHSRSDDLGLKLKGEQLAAGVRFVNMVREGAYDLVVANPPYQGTSKMSDTKYVEATYSLGKANLYAAFLLRGVELVRKGGVSAMLTMRDWMFLTTYAGKTSKSGKHKPGLRDTLLTDYDLRAIGDFAIGAFDEVPNDVLGVAVSVVHRAEPRNENSVAQLPTPPDDRSYDRQRTRRKRAATLCHVGRYEFDPAALKVVPEWPLVYWWDENFLGAYENAAKLADFAPVTVGLQTSDNPRYLRLVYEVGPEANWATPKHRDGWAPYIKGGEGRTWIEPSMFVVDWASNGLAVKAASEWRHGSVGKRVASEDRYFTMGVSFPLLGASFSGRVHSRPSIIDVMGASVFECDVGQMVCLLNSRKAKFVLESLNPTIHFTSGDVNRLPHWKIDDDSQVFDRLQSAFTDHEAHREPSIDYREPGPSSWRQTQTWAQEAVDRPEDAPLIEYTEELDAEPPTDHVSFGLGVAIGRFGIKGEGILDPTKDGPSKALPAGVFFLNGTLDADSVADSLGNDACTLLHKKWKEYGPDIDTGSDLRTWLRTKFFKDVHKGMYETRPIYFPLSSERKTFVAFVSIHRWDGGTLRALLADHLHPALSKLDGELPDLRAALQSSEKAAKSGAEDRYAKVTAWKKELEDFIEAIQQCDEKGPPPSDSKTPEREVDARYAPDLDDGVMINSAALWPLLYPQWDKPKAWWKELAQAKKGKDYDWAHLAARYFPTRVDDKCKDDPSLGVAHGCFWKYHAAVAYKWELRLQDEITPDFTIDEEGAGEFRAAFEAEYADKAEELVVAEQKRRDKKRKKQESLDFGAGDAEKGKNA